MLVSIDVLEIFASPLTSGTAYESKNNKKKKSNVARGKIRTTVLSKKLLTALQIVLAMADHTLFIVAKLKL